MHSIHIEFKRLKDLLISECLGKIGVYVLWDARAQARPTYIGEGEVLSRIVSHFTSGKISIDVEGYVALLGDFSSKKAKKDAELIEQALLFVADVIDKHPSLNLNNGKISPLISRLRKDGLFKIYISGYDPLRHPKSNPILYTKKKIVYDDKSSPDDLFIDHDWKHRKKLLR